MPLRKKILTILVINIISYFLVTDTFVLITQYEENTFENLIDRKVISDSTNWNRERAKIVNITKVSGSKHTRNKVILGIEYINELNPKRKAYNLLNIPYLLIIGTTKEVGDSVNIIYNKNISWSERKNAIYLPTKKDAFDNKMIRGIRSTILLIFLIFFIRKERSQRKTQGNKT